MNNILKKVDESIELIDAISLYYEDFHKLLTDKRIASELDEEIKQISGSSRLSLMKRLKVFESSAIKDLSFEETTTLVFQTYQLLKEYENLIDKIDNQLTEWNVFIRPDIITSEVSQTKLTDISQKSYKLNLLLANFKRKYEDYDISIIKNMSDFILSRVELSAIQPKHIQFLQESFRKYTLTIDIYAVVLQSIMDGNKSLLTTILQTVENDKTFIIGNTHSNYTFDNIKIKPVQNPAHRYFGLVPSDISKPLDQLFPTFTDRGDPEKVLANIATKNAVSIIYMKKFTAFPIEFQIWKLTRIEESAKYIVQDKAKNSGLSSQLIDRMKVINYIESPEKSNKWNLSEYVLIGPNNSEMFYVIDSFNNKTFRFLRPWTASANASAKIPRSYVTGLLTYMGVIEGNNKDRISLYNEIVEDKIYKTMFLKSPINVEELVADVQAETDSPKLKQELLTMISKKIKSPKNWSELGAILHNSDILDEFADGLIKLYPKHFKDNINNDKRVQFPFSETLSTFLVELNNVKRSFGRSLHEKYVKTAKDVQLTAFRSKDNIQLFVNELIKNALDDIITNKSNVYSSLLMKNKILTIELNESDMDKITGGGIEKGAAAFDFIYE